MRTFALVFLYFKFFTLCDCQNITANVTSIVTYVGNNDTFNVTALNFPNGQNMNCSITDVKGYSLANQSFSQTNNVLIIALSSYRVGRTNDIVCVAIFNTVVYTTTVSFTVRPNIKALVCDSVNAVIIPNRDITASVSIRFTDALLNTGKINCSSNNLISGNSIVAARSATNTMSLSFNNSVNISETINCNFVMNSLQQNFKFIVNFMNANIFFNPNSIITDSPLIQMNLFINFQPYQDLSLNCYAIVNMTQPLCANISQYSLMLNWNVTTNVVFTANSTITVQIINLVKMNSTPGVQDFFTVVCCNSNFSATAAVTLNYPANDISIQASTGETVYPYLQFYQMSLCPCDLTVGQCDINCCCDTLCDCSSPNVIPISGPYGGYFNDTPRYSCQSPYQLTTEPFHSLLCVQFNTTNKLGYYFNTSPIILTNDGIQSSLSSANRNSFQFSLLNQDISTSKITAYSANGALASYLYLPKQVVDSNSCNLLSPVTLFEPYDSSCPFIVTSDNCNNPDSRISFANYLISTTAIQTNCISNISLMNINQNTPIYTFYQANSTQWDDGYTLPSYPQSNGTCNNVVTAVNYTIAYNSTSIVSIRADIKLADFNFNSTIYQRFMVSFMLTNTTTNSLVNQNISSVQDSTNTQPTSSGLYGYEDGLPVLLNNSIPMKTFVPDVSGLCQTTSGGRNVLFRKDSFMQCQYNLINSSCYNRRVDVQAYLDSFLANTAVAVYGSPQSSSDYVNVVSFFNITVNMTTPSTNQNNTFVVPIDSLQSYCDNIPTGVVFTIYYSRQGKVRNAYIYNIRGVLKSYQLSTYTNLSPNGGRSSEASQITLTSTVEFVMISAGIKGDLNTDDNTQAVCNFDVCITEILYPWLQQYEGKQGFYEEAFGVMLLGLAVFLLVTTHPWW